MALVSDKYITTLDDHYGSLDVAGWITTLKTDFDKYVAGTQQAGWPAYEAWDPSWIRKDADNKDARPNFAGSTKFVTHEKSGNHDGDAWSFGDAFIARFGLPDDDDRFVGYLTTLANMDTGWSGSDSGYKTKSGHCRCELVITPSASKSIKFREQIAKDGTNATALDTSIAEVSYTASLRILGDIYEHKKTAGANEIVCWYMSFKDYSYDEVRNAALTAIGEIGNVDGDGYIL